MNVKIYHAPVKFQLDTGAGVSVINHTDFKSHFRKLELKESGLVLKSYSKDQIRAVAKWKLLSR